MDMHQSIDPKELLRKLKELNPLSSEDNMDYQRHCFVTVGATAGFRPLLEEVTSDVFLKKLASSGFGHLTVQCGPDAKWFSAKISALNDHYGLRIDSFERTNDMKTHFLSCRGSKGRPAGWLRYFSCR